MTAKLVIGDDSAVPPLNLTERSTAPSAPATGDIYLDDGTNFDSGSGNPGIRRYNGSAWEDVSATGGGMSSFTVQGDNASGQAITDGNTLTIAGGTGITTTDSATDTVTIDIDSTVATLTGSQTLTNKTLTTPTIASFANATHNHSNAAGGGTIDAAVITYTPAVLADWDSDADPGDVDNALDQLAERVDDLELAGGGSITTTTYAAIDLGATFTSTSTTLVNVTGSDQSHTFTSSNALIYATALLQGNTGPAAAQAVIQVNSVDGTNSTDIIFPTAIGVMVVNKFTGVSTGGSVTIRLRVKSSTGSSISVSRSAFIRYTIIEY